MYSGYIYIFWIFRGITPKNIWVTHYSERNVRQTLKINGKTQKFQIIFSWNLMIILVERLVTKQFKRLSSVQSTAQHPSTRTLTQNKIFVSIFCHQKCSSFRTSIYSESNEKHQKTVNSYKIIVQWNSRAVYYAVLSSTDH